MNPVAYVLEGMAPVTKHGEFLVDLKIKNHDAMSALARGTATKQDILTLIAMVNFVEAAYRMGFGAEYAAEVQRGLDALHAVGSRGYATNKFILRAEELNALNTIMELHDAQMEVITVKDMERAFAIMTSEYQSKKMRSIVTKDTDNEKTI